MVFAIRIGIMQKTDFTPPLLRRFSFVLAVLHRRMPAFHFPFHLSGAKALAVR